MNLDRYAKAIVAAVLAGLGVAELAISDNVVTGVEWIRIAVAVVGTGSLVWAVPNAPNVSRPIVAGRIDEPAPGERRQ